MKKIISKRDFDDVVTSLEWVLEKGNFECDCDPYHEWDTNATIHKDNCATSMADHIEITLENIKKPSNLPQIVCLCGSTRFYEAFQRANLEETLAGRIVLTIGCDTKADGDLFGGWGVKEVEALKTKLDELHLRKIDLADEVLILNRDGYIGESTRRELEYARAQGKRIRFLEPDKADQ